MSGSPVSPGRGNSSDSVEATSAHEIVTAAIEAERKRHKNRSSARLSGAALVALRASGIDVYAVAENARWRQILEDATGAETPEEAEQWLVLSGLSIDLHGGYGTWGCETLECLFAELGIEPGDDFQTAVEHVHAVSGAEK